MVHFRYAFVICMTQTVDHVSGNWYWLLQFSLRRFLAFLRVTTPSFLPSIDFRSFVHLFPANYCWRVILCFKRIMPCDSILHRNLRSLKIIENKWWKTIIDDKVCKLALRLIVLSTLDITSWSEEKKSILTGFFWTKNGLHLYPDFFSWQAKYKSTNGLFFYVSSQLRNSDHDQIYIWQNILSLIFLQSVPHHFSFFPFSWQEFIYLYFQWGQNDIHPSV